MKRQALSFQAIKTSAFLERQPEVDEKNFSAPYHAGGSFMDFFYSLSNLGSSKNLCALRDTLVQTHQQKKPIILGLNEQAIETGMSPFFIHLMEQRLISSLAMTAQAMLQDVEIALCGHTCSLQEHREQSDNEVRLTTEAGALIHGAINQDDASELGLAQRVGQALLNSEASHLDHSLLAVATRYHIPLTVHPAVGADSFMLHPEAKGDALGSCSFEDFRRLAALLAQSSNGVVINLASSVILPRIFSHALDAARNLGHDVSDLHLLMIDTTKTASVKNMRHCFETCSGQATYLPGPSEVLLPLLFASVLEALNDAFDEC
ncbi:MAG: hypothetical protein Q9M28_11490 [Mariprofundaceae bacterium]|nr:hypothetical protein [Mariprofundaceae bacterium]